MRLSQAKSVIRCISSTLKLSPLCRSYSSALYITGDKASNTFAVLNPHLDLEERLTNREELVNNLKSRGISMQVSNIEEMYLFYKSLEYEKSIAETTRTEIAKRINTLMKNPQIQKDDIEKLKTPAAVAKKAYQDLKEQFWAVEEIMALKILSLPNVLHLKTPLSTDNTFHTYLTKPEIQTDFHLNLANKNNLLEYSDPTFVVLKNDAALFELAVTNLFQNHLLDSNFTQFSNSDFARSIVVEGCGLNFKSKYDVFTLCNMNNETSSELTKNHLVGGASLFAFMAYFAKHSIQSGYIPLRLFSNGRTYNPVQSEEHSLFNVMQATGINVFIATAENNNALDVELDILEKIVVDLYESLGHHFKISYIRCNKLHKSESLRVSIDMYSPHLQRYIEVGNISVYDTYVSKRLLLTYTENKQRKFMKVISGNILNVQKLLGCLIENNDVNKSDLLSTTLKQHLPM